MISKGEKRLHHDGSPDHPPISTSFRAAHIYHTTGDVSNHTGHMLFSSRLSDPSHLRRARSDQEPTPARRVRAKCPPFFASLSGRHSTAHTHGLRPDRLSPACFSFRLHQRHLQDHATSITPLGSYYEETAPLAGVWIPQHAPRHKRMERPRHQ